MSETFWTISVPLPLEEAEEGLHELLLPVAIARRTARMFVVSAGVTLPDTPPEVLADSDGYPAVARWSWYA